MARAALLVSSIAGVASLLAAAACDESFPAPLDAPDASAPAPVYLDARPVAATCKAADKPAPKAKIGLEQASPVKLSQPVLVVPRAGRLYVVEQTGLVRLLSADRATATTVIDLRSRIVAGGEAGLLGMAFHPRFAESKYVYLYFTAKHPTVPTPDGVVFQSVLARYESPDGGLTLDPSTEKQILVVDQPFSNHNGAHIAFGKDGYLYWGLGDGGSGGDPKNFAQNKDALLGKVLRIDVDGGDPYAIPADNPFAAGGGRPEIFAYGFRNPYRFSFDTANGDLWLGDVGQGAREEIDKVARGGNYGWRIREGKTCYQATTCDTTGLVDPVVDHERADARAITGGLVYRGTKLPQLANKYVYGDFASGYLFAFDPASPSPKPERLNEDLGALQPSSFALADDGELYLTDYTKGALVRVTASPPAAAEMPERLSKTGCFDPADPRRPIAGLFPYDVNVPQWLDGQTAERFVSIPAAAQIDVRDAKDPISGALVLPPGSVAMRTLKSEGKRTETQMLLRRPDGSWSAYAYRWNADGADATLVTDAAATAACLGCHRAEAGTTLGLDAGQLDREATFESRTGNVLGTLERVGMLTKAVPPELRRPLPAVDGFDTVGRRARAYLSVQCGSCHRGASEADFDVRFTTPLPATRACGTRIRPGDPAASPLLVTMGATDATRMPPGSKVPDAVGNGVVEEWIRSLRGCE